MNKCCKNVAHIQMKIKSELTMLHTTFVVGVRTFLSLWSCWRSKVVTLGNW